MNVGLWFLIVSLFGAAFTANAFRPVRFSFAVVPTFFASWLTIELAPLHLAWQGLATAGFVWAGALGHWTGWVGLGVSLVSWTGLVTLVVRARLVGDGVEACLREALGDGYREEIGREAVAVPSAMPLSRLAMPFRFSRREVERVRHLAYGPKGRRNTLDIYRNREHPSGAPVLVWVHGGAWIVGRKDQQAQPMLFDLAAEGWVCVSINYRLSPKATWPDHIVDVKRALAWVKEHVGEYGGDPGFVLITGGSAGGHLASLAALTPNDPEFQPGFEDADTRVQACVPFYGVYDFTDRHGHRGRVGGRGFVRFLERAVMKVPLEEAPEVWARASSLDHLRADAPPFLVIHGTNDVLAPVAEAAEFVKGLRAVSQAPVAYLELPGTQHAFDIFHSIRTGHVIRGVERFGAWVYARWLEERQGAGSRQAG